MPTPTQTPTKEEKLRAIYEKGVNNGYRYIFSSTYEKDEIVPMLIKIKMVDDLPIYLTHTFAKALGYKLEELGRVADNGKDPLEYLYERFIKAD